MHTRAKYAFVTALMLSFATMMHLEAESTTDSSPRAILDNLFADSPVLLARLEEVATKAEDTLEKIKDLATLSPEDIKLYVNTVTASAKGFLGEIRSNSTILTLLKPIITNKDSLLLKFFEQSNTNTFFENKITSKELLETTLKELITVKDDLMKNLKKGTRSVYEAYKERVEEEKA